MSTYDLANEMERMREDNAQLERERDRLVAERDQLMFRYRENLDLEAERDRLIQALEQIADSHKTFESAGADIRGQHCLDLQRIAREALTKITEDDLRVTRVSGHTKTPSEILADSRSPATEEAE